MAGATPMSDDMRAMGVPPVWVSYVKIDDIDGAAARAAEAGGAVFMPPMDVLDSGRMTLIQDPTGAAFGVWSPRAFEGAALVNRPNTLAWNELQTRDLPAARAFYEHVFGWTADGQRAAYRAQFDTLVLLLMLSLIHISEPTRPY